MKVGRYLTHNWEILSSDWQNHFKKCCNFEPWFITREIFKAYLVVHDKVSKILIDVKLQKKNCQVSDEF